MASWDLSVINPNRLKFLAGLGFKASNQSLQRTAPLERYPVLIAFLRQALFDLTDTVIDLVCDYLWQKHGTAKSKLDALRLDAARSTNEKMQMLNRLLGLILRGNASGEDLNQTLFEAVQEKRMLQLQQETKTLIRPDNDEAIDFFADSYSYLKSFIPNFLTTLSFSSHTPNHPVVKATELLKQMNEAGTRRVPTSAPTSFVSDAFAPYITNRQGQLIRRYYELAALWELRRGLRSEDIFVVASNRYADPASHLISKATWPEYRSEVLRLTMAPPTGEGRIKGLYLAIEKSCR